MMRPLLILLTAFAPAFAAADSESSKLILVTGPKTGTYIAIGRDIEKALEKSGAAVDARESDGSVDNIKQVYAHTQPIIGIVQSDVLGFLQRSKNEESAKIAQHLRLIFPLYAEEIHVLARRGINTMQDLKGKKVVVGEDGSGNMLTAVNLFSILDVTPGQMIKLAPPEGVVAVLRNEADAVVFVGGKPVKVFKNLDNLAAPDNQRYAGLVKDVHFLALDDPKLLAEYRTAELTPADYQFLDAKVPTVAVDAALITYDYSGNKKFESRCLMLKKFADAMRKALPALKSKGHPKWNEVHLNGDTNLWRKDACAWPDGQASAKEVQTPSQKELMDVLKK